MNGVRENIFIIGVDMENRIAENIARNAVVKIAAITDHLAERQKKEYPVIDIKRTGQNIKRIMQLQQAG